MKTLKTDKAKVEYEELEVVDKDAKYITAGTWIVLVLIVLAVIIWNILTR